MSTPEDATAPTPPPGSTVPPPLAPRREHVLHGAGGDRHDPWHWLADAENPEVLALLRAENDHFANAHRHLADLRSRIVAEIRARVVEDDTTVAVPRGPWEYYRRTRTGEQYPLLCRRPRGAADDAGEQVLLDVNSLAGDHAAGDHAAGHDYVGIGAYAVSVDQRRLLYSVDLAGDERYTLTGRTLDDGADGADPGPPVTEQIADVAAGGCWAADGRTVFFLRMDAAHRPHQVWRHTLGTPAAADTCVFTEDDERFTVDDHRSGDDAVVLIESRSRTTAECHWVDADHPEGPLRCVLPRRDGVDYDVEHHRGRGSFFVLTDDLPNGASRDFRLCELPVDPSAEDGDPGDLLERVPTRPGVRLEDMTVLAGHVVLLERADAGTRMAVLDLTGGPDGDRPEQSLRREYGDEPVCTVALGANAEFDTSVVRFLTESFTTPRRTYDLDLTNGTRTLLRQAPVQGGYDPADYRTERAWAPAPDGTAIPVSVVRRIDVTVPAPLLLYGYGSYEISIDPSFSAIRPSLLDRGVVFAVAHVRGGGEMGRRWYDEGHLAAKANTFTDYVAAAEHLIARGDTEPGRILGRGGSAGGLLMGAVLNARPDLFAGVLAEVPFVDILTTMEDETLPLTIGEYEEWGDPRRAEAYATMARYSPYDNVAAARYPRVLATGGLNDPRVGFWEPAKWVQRLRGRTAGDAPMYLRTELSAGHGGVTGRYAVWADEAELLAFLLDAAGLSARE